MSISIFFSGKLPFLVVKITDEILSFALILSNILLQIFFADHQSLLILSKHSWGQFHQHFTCNKDPKSARRHWWLDCLFSYLGSERIEILRKHVGEIDPLVWLNAFQNIFASKELKWIIQNDKHFSTYSIFLYYQTP